MYSATSVGKRDLFLLRLLLQDGNFSLQVGRLDVGDQSPLEAAAQAVFEFRQLLRRPVAGDHDLLHRLVQRIEGVEELFLRALFLRQELDVVHQQHVHLPEFIAEAGHLVVAQRVDHLVGELLARHIADRRLRRPPLDLVADRLHQVRLAHPDAAIQEQRVVGLRGPLGHSLAGRMGKLVAAADHECVKGVAWIQLRRAIPVEPPLRGMQPRRRLHPGSATRAAG